MAKNSIVAKYLNDFFNKIEGNISGEFIFRGHANSNWKLLSSAARRLLNNNKKRRSDFIRYHTNLIENARNEGFVKNEILMPEMSDLEILAEIQHFGGSTCLIDFTNNFLVALWFASATSFKEDKYGNRIVSDNGFIPVDGKIIIIDLNSEANENKIFRIIKHHSRDTIEDLLMGKIISNDLRHSAEPKFWNWQPPKLNSRIVRQKSIFMFGLGNFEEGLDHISIIIHNEDKKNLRYELEAIFNITTETIYNDFSGFSYEANNPSSPINNSLLTGLSCLANAKDYYYKEEENIAINYLNEAINCNYENSTCNKGCSSRDFGELYFRRGLAYSRHKCYTQALTDFDYAIQFPNTPEKYKLDAYRNKADIYYELKEFRNAIAVYRDILKIFHPNKFDLCDCYYSILELAIISNDKITYDEYIDIIDRIPHLKDQNGFLLYTYFRLVGDHYFNRTIENISVKKFEDEFKFEADEIKYYFGGFDWEFKEMFQWGEELKFTSDRMEDSEKILALTNKALEIQDYLLDRICYQKSFSIKEELGTDFLSVKIKS